MKIQNGPADKARKARSATVAGEQSGKKEAAKGGSSIDRSSDRVVLSERLGTLATPWRLGRGWIRTAPVLIACSRSPRGRGRS